MTTAPTFRRLSKAYIPTPPKHDQIWRVMSLDKLETLAKGGLWLARLDQFGTSYEGALPENNKLGLLAMLPPEGVAWVEKEYRASVFCCYASCWHVNPQDPKPQIWDAFDEKGEGLAVRSTYSSLVKELEMTCDLGEPGRGPIHIGSVRYINHALDTIPDWNVLEAAFVIREKWSYQDELRVLVNTRDSMAYDHLYNRLGPFGPLIVSSYPNQTPVNSRWVGGHNNGRAIVFRVNPRSLISEILPNRRMQSGDLWRLYLVAARYGLAHLIRVDRRRAVAMKAAAMALQLAYTVKDFVFRGSAAAG